MLKLTKHAVVQLKLFVKTTKNFKQNPPFVETFADLLEIDVQKNIIHRG